MTENNRGFEGRVIFGSRVGGLHFLFGERTQDEREARIVSPGVDGRVVAIGRGCAACHRGRKWCADDAAAGEGLAAEKTLLKQERAIAAIQQRAAEGAVG